MAVFVIFLLGVSGQERIRYLMKKSAVTVIKQGSTQLSNIVKKVKG